MIFSKPSRFVDRIFLHCSASDNPSHDNLATIKRWHTDPKPRGRGWSDTGYHYFVRKDGTLESGRPIERTPAAQAGHNTGSIAICLHGLKVDNFTEKQFETLRALCLKINNAYNGALTFHGHREVAAKACPVFNYKKVLKLDSYGRLGARGCGGGGSGDERRKKYQRSGQSCAVGIVVLQWQSFRKCYSSKLTAFLGQELNAPYVSFKPTKT